MEVPISLQPCSLFFKKFPHKRLLHQLRKETSKYILQFEKVLKMHLTTEFEVKLHNGEITNSGHEILLKLQHESEVLDYEARIDE